MSTIETKIKFKKMLTDGYLVVHRGMPIIVKKTSSRTWLAQVYKQNGYCSFTLPDTYEFGETFYDHEDRRKLAVERVIEQIDERAETSERLRNYLDHLQSKIKEEEEFFSSM